MNPHIPTLIIYLSENSIINNLNNVTIMKKLFALIPLLCLAIGGWAQNSHFTVTQPSGQPYDRTVILADLVNNIDQTLGNWEIAAFVGDECRWAGQTTTQNNEAFYWIEVWGNSEDANKEITFRAYNSDLALEYDLTPSEAITWQGEKTYGGTGSSANRVKLNLTAATSYTLTDFEVEVGETVNLLDYLTVEPANASLPRNHSWNLGNFASFATINGDELTAGETPRSNLTLRFVCGKQSATGTFSIIKHATAIKILRAEYETPKGNEYDLHFFLTNGGQVFSYELDPIDATDEVKWEYDEDYIEIQDGKYIAIKGGTINIRPYVEVKGTKIYPENPAYIALTIIVPVTGLTFNWPEKTNFLANVGDDLYQRIADRVSIQPTDATNKDWHVDYLSDDEGAFTIAEGSVVANKSGLYVLRVVSNDNPQESQDFQVEVYNPAKTVTISNDPLYIDFNVESPADIIKDNIVLNPTDFDKADGQLIIGGDNLAGTGSITDNGVMVSLSKFELGEGQVSVNLYYDIYDNYDGTEGSIQKSEGESYTFSVIVTAQLEKFAWEIVPNESDPTTGEIRLTPQPEGATFDINDYAMAVGNNPRDDWNIGSFKRTSADGEVPIVYSYSFEVPGYWDLMFGQFVDGYVVESLLDYTNDYPAVTIPLKVEYNSGWQWKSTSVGIIDLITEDYIEQGKAALGGDNLIEARTQEYLLYNDPSWGYWGSMMGTMLDYSTFYKVNMKKTDEVYNYNVQMAEATGCNLQYGWNWVGTPYIYDRNLKKLLNNETVENYYNLTDSVYPSFIDGMVIVTKTGSMEFSNGKWNGDEIILKAGEGFKLYYPNELGDDDGAWLELPSELYGALPQGNETANAARSMRRSVWSYDHSRFASNMTMVIDLDQIDQPENYTIGAFVDGECRGEGHYIDGHIFATVHANAGEMVSFQLHNELTGEFFDIDQTVSTQSRVGSLRAPFRMSSNAVVTGVNSVQSSEFTVQSYDLSGRKVDSQRRGLVIERRADGRVHKLMK